MSLDELWLWWLERFGGSSKSCGRCGQAKRISEFVFKDADERVRHSWCRECFAEYKRDWYRRNRDNHIKHVKRNREGTTAQHRLRVWQYLAQHPCVDCHETDVVVLEFDHVRGKRHDVSFMVASGFKWTAIQEEIEKCEVRCANCHRRRTAKERGFYDRKRSGAGEATVESEAVSG